MKTKVKKVVVKDNFQKNYTYYLTKKVGCDFDPEFRPDLTPKQMLKLGIFDGFYVDNSYINEFPKDWFKNAKLSKDKPDPKLNYFGIHASQSLDVWRKKGWIHENDPRGWFQWYCRYYMGRRIESEDKRQIRRWKAMKRHIGQLVNNCRSLDLNCRIKQRQALLHWAYDTRKI